jgi:hypothetical protein
MGGTVAFALPTPRLSVGRLSPGPFSVTKDTQADDKPFDFFCRPLAHERSKPDGLAGQPGKDFSIVVGVNIRRFRVLTALLFRLPQHVAVSRGSFAQVKPTALKAAMATVSLDHQKLSLGDRCANRWKALYFS